MYVQYCDGTQLWDTAFSAQAIIATGFSEEFGPTLKKAHKYVKDSQVLEDCPGDLNYWHRHISKGRWTLCTADHEWPVSDCTSEGLKETPSDAALFLRSHKRTDGREYVSSPEVMKYKLDLVQNAMAGVGGGNTVETVISNGKSQGRPLLMGRHAKCAKQSTEAWVLRKLGDANPEMNINVEDLISTIVSSENEDMTGGTSS